MSLYGLIYDFFATHIFNDSNELGAWYLSDFGIQIHNSDANYSPLVINYVDWLCHTATIISITIIVVLCAMFIYKIVKIVGGLIR